MTNTKQENQILKDNYDTAILVVNSLQDGYNMIHTAQRLGISWDLANMLNNLVADAGANGDR